MKKFLVVVLKYLFGLVICQALWILLFLKVNSLANSPLFLSKNKSVIKKKIFILGNSQPECGINDSMFSHKFENVALSGEPLFYSIIKARALLSDCELDTVFFGFSPNSLHSIKNVIDDKRLLNDYKKNFVRLSFHEHIFLLENNLKKSLKTWYSMTPKDLFKYKSRINGGFRPLTRTLHIKPVNNRSDGKIPADSTEILRNNGFNNLLKLIDSYPKTTFIFLRFPEHPSIHFNSGLFDKAVCDINNQRNAQFYDFSLAFEDNIFFADEQHLNKKGADSFTIKFAKKFGFID